MAGKIFYLLVSAAVVTADDIVLYEAHLTQAECTSSSRTVPSNPDHFRLFGLATSRCIDLSDATTTASYSLQCAGNVVQQTQYSTTDCSGATVAAGTGTLSTICNLNSNGMYEKYSCVHQFPASVPSVTFHSGSGCTTSDTVYQEAFLTEISTCIENQADVKLVTGDYSMTTCAGDALLMQGYTTRDCQTTSGTQFRGEGGGCYPYTHDSQDLNYFKLPDALGDVCRSGAALLSILPVAILTVAVSLTM